jgi:ketosteroid isomerase-like protein
MDDFGAFLARVIRQLRSEGTTTLGPRKALWSHEDPVTLFGAEASASGWEAIERIFNRLAQSFSDGQSCTYDVVGAGVSGDLGYVAANRTIRCRHARVGGPAVMATLRNLAISVHRLAGAARIAAASRRVSRHPARALRLVA